MSHHNKVRVIGKIRHRHVERDFHKSAATSPSLRNLLRRAGVTLLETVDQLVGSGDQYQYPPSGWAGRKLWQEDYTCTAVANKLAGIPADAASSRLADCLFKQDCVCFG